MDKQIASHESPTGETQAHMFDAQGMALLTLMCVVCGCESKTSFGGVGVDHLWLQNRVKTRQACRPLSISFGMPALLSSEEYSDSDFASRGDKRVTKYQDHCPTCSLDLRKIINAVKSDDGDAAAGGPSSSASEPWDLSQWPNH